MDRWTALCICIGFVLLGISIFSACQPDNQAQTQPGRFLVESRQEVDGLRLIVLKDGVANTCVLLVDTDDAQGGVSAMPIQCK